MQENKAAVERIFSEVWNGKNRDVIDDLIDADIVVENSEGGFHGAEAYKEFFDRFADAFPDSRLDVVGMVAEGDSVATGYVFFGTHTGDLGDIPATGRQVSVKGTVISRFADGKCTHERSIWDTGAMMRQLGLDSAGD